MDGWNFKKINAKKTYVLPAGTYYIGDICYVLADELYENVFGGTGYECGHYTSDQGQFLVDGTYAGDGSYRGSDGFEYAVDAGIIGIVSQTLLSKETDGGKIYEFATDVRVSMQNGIFIFESDEVSLEINTKDYAEDEDDEDDE